MAEGSKQYRKIRDSPEQGRLKSCTLYLYAYSQIEYTPMTEDAVESRLRDIDQSNRAVDQRLTRIETILEDLKHRLLGNGQPGELSLMNARTSGEIAALAVRVKGLEEFRWKAVGVIAAAALGLELVLKFALKG